MTFPPIAIVGQGCVLPGAFHPDQFGEAILAGRDLLGPAPERYWRLPAHKVVTSPDRWAPDKTWSDRGGYVRGFERVFDPSGFRLPAELILSLDEQFHWVFHAAQQALRQGSAQGGLPARSGLVLGNLAYPTARLTEYAEVILRQKAGPVLGQPPTRPDPINRFHAGLVAHLAAKALGLGAEAFALDAACASSLYALKLACDRLHDGSADLMLAGGAHRTDDLLIHTGFAALRALSRSGRSRPFHRDADGLVPAEGAVLFALKRLPDALAAGDAILGVIRGIGLSNDGRKGGFLSPSVEGQARAMRSAYEQAGCSPRDISLVECHATGTLLGDGVEIASMREIFADADDLPIGSLKSNLGHLITAAGAAGLLKVLAAFRVGIRPATLHAMPLREELLRRPFRVLRQPEPWPSANPRRAAVSAFGFGGSNAHLVVEEWHPATQTCAVTVPEPIRCVPVAIVGLAVHAGGCPSTDAFADLLFGETPAGSVSARIEEIELDAETICFPPRDLKRVLPQQLLVLRTALLATANLSLPAQKTGVFVGMECDAEIARATARIRLPEWVESGRTEIAPLEGDWLTRAQDALTPPLEGAAVVGAMPNIPANRINVQLNYGGPGYTVSAEELSGIRALEIALRGLRAGEIDAALVSAVDLSCEPVHAETAAALLPPNRHQPGDAAVTLVLQRLDDARRSGHPILAVFDEPASIRGEDPLSLRLDEENPGLATLLGHSHATSGLLLVAAAALALKRRLRPVISEPGIWPWLSGPRQAEVLVQALGGQAATVHLREESQPTSGLAGCPFPDIPQLHVFAGRDRRAVLEALEQDRESDQGPARLVLVASSREELNRSKAWAKTALARQASLLDAKRGIYFRNDPLEGKLAFVGSSAVAGYPNMGAELLWAFPDLVTELARACLFPPEVECWYRPDQTSRRGAFAKLTAGMMLTTVHGLFSRTVLGLKPEVLLGLSSGEKDVLFAAGVCPLEALATHFQQVREESLLTAELSGDFRAVRRAWGLADQEPVNWALWRIVAPVDHVKQALSPESRAHLAIVLTPQDVVIAGDRDACSRVLDRLGRPTAFEATDYQLAFHVPELLAARSAFRRCFTFPMQPSPQPSFYSSARGEVLPLTSESFAEDYLAQASATVDFPRVICKAWADGVRLFVEHGPHSHCSGLIDEILGDRPHLSVALDAQNTPALRAAALASAELLAAGVPLDWRAFNARMELCRAGAARSSAPTAGHPLRYPAHFQPIVLPPYPKARMEAPCSPTDLPDSSPLSGAERDRQEDDVPALVVEVIRQQREVFSHQLQCLAAGQQRLLSLQALTLQGLTRNAGPVTPPQPLPEAGRVERQTRIPPVAPELPPGPRGPVFNRKQLEVLATGRISDVFGPRFARQDAYRRQVRLPAPPLLLVDRITGLEADPGSLGTGTIWTETDIRWDSWYLQQGVMPAGIMIESGQADLTLISWMGADFLNRGERVYRLLGCDLTFHGGLPRPGDTLCYDIHIDGHSRQGDIRLFFFHYDCRINGQLRMTVRNGQAGFFTDEELTESGGVLWSAATGEHSTEARLDLPAVASQRFSFCQEQLIAYYDGRAADCLGPGYELLHTHTRTPLGGNSSLRMLDEVTHIDAKGGPWGRGYLRARKVITPQDWYFDGHFKDDPCMPGTLKFEGTLQAMAFYLTWLGYTLERDGWRFEPIPEETYRLRCRGQVVPTSREMVCELFIEEVHDGPEPVLYADLLGSVDGLKAFYCRRMGLRLVPDWPLSSRPELLAGRADRRPVAVAGDVCGDFTALLACAWGKPSDAFGAMYRPFDGTRRTPRLPGPPYHFLSRITCIDAQAQTPRPGASIEAEYDVPADAWYFQDHTGRAMPFCVLMELCLQPCGWLASFLGFTLHSGDDLFFRNLDGKAIVDRTVPPGAGTLRIRATLKGFSEFRGLAIVSFETACLLDEQPVCCLETSFGFFTREALAQQVGLPPAPAEGTGSEYPSGFSCELTKHTARYFDGSLHLPRAPLLMLDRIVDYWPEGGKARLGRLCSEQTVNPAAWYFKAHFYQDPVQPGSLGVEAMLQLLQFYMIERDLHEGIDNPVFEPIASGRPITWKYRGQVVPRNASVQIEMEVMEVGRDERGTYAVADAWLWVDGLRIYCAQGLALRVVAQARNGGER